MANRRESRRLQFEQLEPRLAMATWTGAATDGRLWGTAENWDGGVPEDTEVAIFDTAGPLSVVNSVANASAKKFVVNKGQLNFDLSKKKLDIVTVFPLLSGDIGLTVGVTDSASVVFQNSDAAMGAGTVEVETVEIGKIANLISSVKFDGSGVIADLKPGNAGFPGTVDVADGANSIGIIDVANGAVVKQKNPAVDAYSIFNVGSGSTRPQSSEA